MDINERAVGKDKKRESVSSWNPLSALFGTKEKLSDTEKEIQEVVATMDKASWIKWSTTQLHILLKQKAKDAKENEKLEQELCFSRAEIVELHKSIQTWRASEYRKELEAKMDDTIKRILKEDRYKNIDPPISGPIFAFEKEINGADLETFPPTFFDVFVHKRHPDHSLWVSRKRKYLEANKALCNKLGKICSRKKGGVTTSAYAIATNKAKAQAKLKQRKIARNYRLRREALDAQLLCAVKNLQGSQVQTMPRSASPVVVKGKKVPRTEDKQPQAGPSSSLRSKTTTVKEKKATSEDETSSEEGSTTDDGSTSEDGSSEEEMSENDKMLIEKETAMEEEEEKPTAEEKGGKTIKRVKSILREGRKRKVTPEDSPEKQVHFE